MGISRCALFTVVLAVFPGLSSGASGQAAPPDKNLPYDAAAALQTSQAAIGRKLTNHAFLDHHGNKVELASYAGKPLLISLIFTSCHQICPVTTKRLARAVENAREVLDDDSFHVITVGFDARNDTPDRMRVFAREQGISSSGWDFLSATPEVAKALTDELGFIYFPSPRGFDHITQISVVDRNGILHTQVYGESFELPWLVEPLKNLVLNRPESAGHPIATLIDRIRLFCTVYDPGTGRYGIDYSLFIQMAIGLMIVVSVATYLVRESRRARHG